ncbi:hypothetical protein KR018_011629 [Drosophila ironensis]|nr:hypothetical protein KR018_011629 [Drosophila ironensis]
MASTSRAARSLNAGLSQDNATQPITRVDDKVRGMFNYILDHSADKLPIKEKDLAATFGDKKDVVRRMPLVKQLLATRFGIRLMKVDHRAYICTAEEPMASMHELTAAQRPQFTLICLVLMYIFLRDNRIEDVKLYGMLETIEINVDEDHSYFGPRPRKLIEETFVKQLYLRRERSQPNAYDDPKVFFYWGARAKAEFKYEQVVQFASKLLKLQPDQFDHQLKAAKELDYHPED